jgi:putative OmpL-like beta-barrel porin-2
MRSAPSEKQDIEEGALRERSLLQGNGIHASTERNLNRSTMKTLLRKAGAYTVFSALLAVGVVVSPTPRCFAQTQPQAPPKVAALVEPAEGAAADVGATKSSPPSPAVAAADPALSPSVAKELEAMKARIELLEMQLKASAAGGKPSEVAPDAQAKTAAPAPALVTPSPAPAALQTQAEATPAAAPAVDNETPFAFADWTWLNGTPRNKDAVWDSKFFTPEIRFDTDFVSSFNHPKDDTLGGSTEIFRSNEFQVEQISVGGDFHWQNVRGRLLTLGGMFGVTTPRNDASVGRGQWDLRGAYKYFAEAYGGYHFNVNHGLNVDAGIFVSYIGLFSYYNFDNWAYQPSFVSSNTPWFFNGLRIQWFPTNKLKIEPWIINGWQSYGRFGNRPGLGGQILYRPKPWLALVFNNYGMGEDTLGLNGARSRIHTDDSVEVKYYDKPAKTLDKMAFSFTADLGCEYGGGVACFGNKKSGGQIIAYKQAFLGWMAYNRWQFKQDKFGFTLGGGVLNNSGRYLTLLPPINGADAISGSPYFPASPGTAYKAWDTSATFDYMPKQYITFRWEYGYRHANQPYWTGRGGITPPGGNNGFPSQFVCMDNTPDPTGAGCGSHGGLWSPDLRKDEPSIRMAIMVKF